MAGSSLRFTVEVAADQADKALKAMTVAFNEAGSQARIAMQSISAPAKAAGAEVVTLGDKIKQVARDQRSEARAAQFYVQSIADIIPVSNSAKIAIGGIGEALIGGVGIGAAIALVTAGIKLMTAAWAEEEAAAKKATDEREKRIAGIQKDIDASRNQGKTPAEITREKIGLVEMQQADRAQEIAGLQAAIDAEKAFPASLRNDTLIAQNEARVTVLKEQIQAAAIEIDKLKESIKEAVEGADRALDASGLKTDISASTASPTGFYGSTGPGQRVVINPMTSPRDDITQGPGSNLPNKEALAEYNREQQRAIALSEQWGATLGNVFAQLAMGQMTAGQALAAIGQMMIQQITSIAISSITASASKAGAEAAASQAGVPVVGPALGIAAMGAMMSAVLALLGNVGKRAAGGQVLAGMPYVVGELGPELFVPGSTGGVVPNHRMPAGGGGITLNVQGLIDSGTLGRTITANDGAFARANRKLRRRRRM